MESLATVLQRHSDFDPDHESVLTVVVHLPKHIKSRPLLKLGKLPLASVRSGEVVWYCWSTAGSRSG